MSQLAEYDDEATPDFEALFAQYHERLRRYVAGQFGVQYADEVAQEAMFRLLTHRADIRTWENPWAWLKTVARNIAIDHLRAETACRTDDLTAAEADPRLATASAEEAVVERSTQRLVHSALRRLDPAYQRVIVMRDFEGRPAEEVGAALGLTANAVRQRLFRAHKQLAKEMRRVVGRGYLGGLFPLFDLLRRLRRHSVALGRRAFGAAVLGLTVAITLGVIPSPQQGDAEATERRPQRVAAEVTAINRPVSERRAAPPSQPGGRPSRAQSRPDRRRGSGSHAVKVTSPPPVGVRTKLPENPLADRDENHAEMWVDTPRGRVHVYTYGANGKSGFLCDTDLVGCN